MVESTRSFNRSWRVFRCKGSWKVPDDCCSLIASYEIASELSTGSPYSDYSSVGWLRGASM